MKDWPNSIPQFDVFLSHNSVDKPWVIKLKDDLQCYGVSVWLDKDEIRPGDLFAEALEEGLENSRAMALIVSPEAMASGWVKEEYYRALSLAQNKHSSLQLIPVILRDAELPGFLKGRSWVDFREESAYSHKVWELVWGITGDKPAKALELTTSTTTSSSLPGESQSPETKTEIKFVFAGQPTDFDEPERLELLFHVLASILQIAIDNIELVVIARGSCVVILRLPEDAASRLLDPEATPLLHSIEDAFIAKAREKELEPDHCRIIRMRRYEPETAEYNLDFANREKELQYLRNPGSPRYIEVNAPAGYGKTYLIDQLEKDFATQGWKVIRVNFDQTDAPQSEAEALATFCRHLDQPEIATIDQLGICTGGLAAVFLFDSTENMPSILKSWLVEAMLPELEGRVRPPRVIAAGRRRVPEWHRYGRPSFASMELTPFDKGIVEAVLRIQVSKRDDLQAELEPAYYRNWAKEISDLSKGHPLCISNVIRWLDTNQNFTMQPSLSLDRKAEIFHEQIRPLIEEQILGHLTEGNTLELVRLFCVLRGYNVNIVSWLARAASKDSVLRDDLREILTFSTRNELGTLRKLNATQLDGRIDAGMFRFDKMIRQLISLQTELENPTLFWRIHCWAVRMYDYWVKGIDRPGKPLRDPPKDSMQAGYMVEALYHHVRWMHHQQVSQDEAGRKLTQHVESCCQQARSAAGWKGQTIEEFINLVEEDDELIHYLELVVSQDQLDTVMTPAHKALEDVSSWEETP